MPRKAAATTPGAHSPLRMVSLPRLEKQVQLAWPPAGSPAKRCVLAGLQRIQYVFVYPETGDLVLAGPAGDWRPGPEGPHRRRRTGRPVLRLDDLVVVLRHMLQRRRRQVRLHDHAARRRPWPACRRSSTASSGGRIRPEQRKAWLEQLRSQLGKQDIEVYGLDPRTRAARVMVEADYRMKLVGMGLEEGVPGVQSYLAMIKLPPGRGPAADGRAALVVHAELRGRARRRKTAWPSPSAARASRCKARTSISRPRASGCTPASRRT